MRQLLAVIWIGLVWGTMAALVGVPCAEDAYPIYVYPAPKATPTVDGALDDACWEEAPLVSGFMYYGQASDEPAPVQTSFRIAYDDTALYFGIVCNEPLAARMGFPHAARDDRSVFGQEAIEIFLDPSHDHRRYYQFGLSAAGALYDSRAEDASWNSRGRVKTQVEENAWTMEFSVSWADLEHDRVIPGQVVGFNVCRDRYVEGREWMNWARTISGFHDPDRFAHLVLSPSAEQLGMLGTEFRKGEREGPIRIFGKEGISHTAYLTMARQALQEVQVILKKLDDMRRREDPTAAAELGRRLGAVREDLRPYEEKVAAAHPLDAPTGWRWTCICAGCSGLWGRCCGRPDWRRCWKRSENIQYRMFNVQCPM